MNIEKIREYCTLLPHATETVQWDDDLVFKIGGKMFCVLGLESQRVSFRIGPERFDEFLERPNIIPAPYMARIHWVSLVTPRALPWAESKELIRASYDHALSKLTKKVRTELLTSEHHSS